MIYIKTDINDKITYVNSFPYDTLLQTETELKSSGYFVETIPEAERRVGYDAIQYYDRANNVVYYKYEPRPLSVEEQLELANQKIQLMQQALDELILGGAL